MSLAMSLWNKLSTNESASWNLFIHTCILNTLNLLGHVMILFGKKLIPWDVFLVYEIINNYTYFHIKNKKKKSKYFSCQKKKKY